MRLSRRDALFTFTALSAGHARNLAFQRGVNLTAEGRGGYTAEMVTPMVASLKAMGVNSVALVPFGFSKPGIASIRYNMGWEAGNYIRESAAAVRKAGLLLLLKPQIWIPGGFTGDLTFTGSELSTWFRQYTEFADYYAELARDIQADLFCVANEFGRLSVHTALWRDLIRSIRKTYKGPLTYAATQGPEFERLEFWDALDYIGLNNYYPLKEDYSAKHIATIIEEISKKFRKQVILTEAGFSSFENPHRQPWDETSRKLVPEHQARAYEAVLQALYDKPFIAGIYWWKVGTNGYGGLSDGSHTPWNKPAMEVVRKWYSSGKR